MTAIRCLFLLVTIAFNLAIIAILVTLIGYALSFTDLYFWMDDHIGLPVHEWIVTHKLY